MKHWGLPIGVAISLLGSILIFHPADQSMPDRTTNEQVKEADVEFFTKEEIELMEQLEEEAARIRHEIEKVREELNRMKEIQKNQQQTKGKFLTV